MLHGAKIEKISKLANEKMTIFTNEKMGK